MTDMGLNLDTCVLMSMELPRELQLQDCKNVFKHQYELWN